MSLTDKQVKEVFELLKLASPKQREDVLIWMLQSATREERDTALIWLVERDSFMSRWLANQAIVAECPLDVEYERAAQKERQEFDETLAESNAD